jgi:hypothetical protein
MSGNPPGEPSARAPRSSVLLRATIEYFGSTSPSAHRVRDLSIGGMCIDQAAGMTQGATVLVTVGALESVGATVVWVKDGQAGLKFAHVIDIDDARTKAAIAPRAEIKRPSSGKSPTAGWIPDLNDPYRK